MIRSGIHGDSFGMAIVDVDLQTSHARAVLHRAAERGADAAPLKHVVEDRTWALAEIHTDKEASKELLNSLINGGSVEAWKHRHGVSYELPKWVEDLRIFLSLLGGKRWHRPTSAAAGLPDQEEQGSRRHLLVERRLRAQEDERHPGIGRR